MLRRKALAGAYTLARASGIDRAVRNSRWRSNRLLILCWHGISIDDEHLWQPGLYVSPDLFRQRLQALETGRYNVLPLDEAVNRLRANDLPPRSVVITFDDGFYDFALHAAPILADFGYPATVYLTTYYVDRQYPVFNLALQYMFWKKRRPDASLKSGQPLVTEEDARSASTAIIRSIPIEANAGQKNEIVRGLADEIGFDYEALLRRRMLYLMNPEEVNQLSQTPNVVFEAHTHRHRTPSDVGLMRRELEENNARIEQLTGRRPIHFCYPSGNYRREHFPLFEQQCFKSATTCELGMASKAAYRYLLPRLLDSADLTPLQYEGWLSGAYAVGRRN